MVPILLAAVLSAPLPAPETSGAWMAPSARCEALAERLHVSPALKPVVVEMCRRAPTFRRQVVRLARQPWLDVTIVPGVFTPTGRTRARTAMTRVDGRLRAATVEVPSGDSLQVVELVAHELEHVLEQLDGVELATWVGRSGVYRVGNDAAGPFETERARQIGRLVAGEFMAAGAEITAARRVW